MVRTLRPAMAATVLLVATLLLPAPLASLWPGSSSLGIAAVREAVGAGLVHLQASGTGRPDAELDAAVDYWARFHVVKAALSGLLLLALLRLGRQLAAAYVGSGPRARRTLIAGTIVLAGALAFVALLALVANLQGAVAPLSSALGLVALDGPATATAAARMRDDLTTGAGSPTVHLLLHDFTRYHAAMAALAGVTTAVLLIADALVWRRRGSVAPDQRRRRRVLAATTVVVAVAATLFAVITAANVSTVRDPEPAFVAFLDGGA